MKSRIVQLTPQLAAELLKKNQGNRDVKPIKSSYVRQMKNGEWKENGEPIIVDKNGIIKDGQHRLMAVVESGHTYSCPIIEDVEPDVMDTIDTGVNRSLSDVLKFNGFNYQNLMAGVVKAILSFERGNSGVSDTARRHVVTNSVGLKFAQENKEALYKLIKTASRLNDRATIRLMSSRDIALFLYVIAKGFDVNEKHVSYMKGVVGVHVDENSACNYVYKKLVASKDSSIVLTSAYKFNLIVKCWNIYSTEDMPISRMVVKTQELETVA